MIPLKITEAPYSIVWRLGYFSVCEINSVMLAPPTPQSASGFRRWYVFAELGAVEAGDFVA